MSDQIDEQKIKQLLMSDNSRNIGIELAGQFLGWSVVDCVKYCVLQFHKNSDILHDLCVKESRIKDIRGSISFNFEWCKFYFDIEFWYHSQFEIRYDLFKTIPNKKRHLVNFYHRTSFDNPCDLLTIKSFIKELESHIKYYAEKTN